MFPLGWNKWAKISVPPTFACFLYAAQFSVGAETWLQSNCCNSYDLINNEHDTWFLTAEQWSKKAMCCRGTVHPTSLRGIFITSHKYFKNILTVRTYKLGNYLVSIPEKIYIVRFALSYVVNRMSSTWILHYKFIVIVVWCAV